MHPSLTTESEQEAKYLVDRFITHFDKSYRQLAYYAAIPLILTPELLNFMRNRFLRGRVPWIAEADLLLSDLCKQAGYEQYTLKPAVRAYLLTEMKEQLGSETMKEAAKLLIQYVQLVEKQSTRYRREELRHQQWAAMVYLDDQREQAVKEMATDLKAQVTEEKDNAGRIDRMGIGHLSRIVESLAPQLNEYEQLVDFAREIGDLVDNSKSLKPNHAYDQTREVAGVRLSIPESILETLQVRKSETSNKEIMDFILRYFSESELKQLYFDYFPEVENLIGSGMSRFDKVHELIGYCQRREMMGSLLGALEQERKTMYQKAFPKQQRKVLAPAKYKPQPRNPKQIFIAHASPDADLAQRLAKDLQQNKFDIFITPMSIRPGEKWVPAISRGLDESGIFLVLLTPHAVQSGWVQDETNTAIALANGGKARLYFLDVEPCQLPILWQQRQLLSFRSKAYKRNLETLLQVLDGRLDDKKNPTNKQLREFMMRYFNDPEIESFCSDYFPEVRDNFSRGLDKNKKIMDLIAYCRRREMMGSLLVALEHERKKLYQEAFPRQQNIAPTPAIYNPQPRNPNQIFIAHASPDADLAQRLAKDLQQNKFDIFITPMSIRPGEKWVPAISRGLDESGIFLVLLTPNAVQSAWVQNETNTAIALANGGKARLLFLDVADCKPPSLWQQWQLLSFRSKAYNRNLERLLQALDV